MAFLFFGIWVNARVHNFVLVCAHRVVGYFGGFSAIMRRYAQVHGSVLVHAHRVVYYFGRVLAMIGRYAGVDRAIVGIPNHVVLRIKVGEGAGACLVECHGSKKDMQGQKPHLVWLKKCLWVED